MAEIRRRRDRPIYAVDGVVVTDPNQLVWNGRAYAEAQLVHCLNGHFLLTPGAVVIGWISCPVPGVRGGHRLTRCGTCQALDHRPPLDPDCPCQQQPFRAPYMTTTAPP
ncbi:hypothetical protein [Nocardia sp. NBC_01327]|uniref:hypothetical protein n=1 Tax=Nocardia sp. NBC_01327 TaxID=2903593 RepID=UPI002E14B4B9|nr:hypothetical protein OG326_42355 [Nocardia sp. NBC_01327]